MSRTENHQQKSLCAIKHSKYFQESVIWEKEQKIKMNFNVKFGE